MAETSASGRSRHVVEHALGHGLVQDVHQLVRLELAQRRQGVQAELAADDGRREEQSLAARREPRHAPADHGTDPRRDAHGRVGLLHAALRGEQVHDLRDEERIPLRLGVDRIDEARPGLDRRS